MLSPRKEAEMITEVLFNEYGSSGVIPPCLPPIQESREAIHLLKKKGIEYKKDNWIELYFKFRTLELLENKKPGHFKNKIFHNNYFIQGDHSWDIQINTIDYWDRELLEEFVKTFGGIGVLLIVTHSKNKFSREFGTDFFVLHMEAFFYTKNEIHLMNNEDQSSQNIGHLFMKNFNWEPDEFDEDYSKGNEESLN
ncbi:MAG: hypothetical protein ACFFB5_01405 [Promethearchaeota archaeon]